MKKKILAMLLAAVLAVGLLPVSAFAADEVALYEVSGTVKDEAGKPIPGITVWVYYMSMPSGAVDACVTDENGRYTLKLANGGFSVYANMDYRYFADERYPVNEGYTSHNGNNDSIVIKNADITDHDITLYTLYEVTGTVVSTIEDWNYNWITTVTADRTDSGLNESFDAFCEDGGFTLRLPNGAYTLTVTSVYNYMRSYTATVDVTVNGADLSLDPITISEDEPDPAEPENPFTDVAEGVWYADSVLWAVEKGITTGTDDGTTFEPDRDCRDIEILTMLYRADSGESQGNGGDMDKAVEWARELDLIGEDYDVTTPCTRATAVWYIWKVLGADESAPAYSFTDVEADADYAAAVNWAVATGVTNGSEDGTTFSPDATCDRSMIVTFLYRAYANSVSE